MLQGAIPPSTIFYQGMANEEPGRNGVVDVPAAVTCMDDNPLQ
jgi:hypothetical protein